MSPIIIKCTMLCTMSSKKVLREWGDCNISDFTEGVQLFDTLLIFSADSLLQNIPLD